MSFLTYFVLGAETGAVPCMPPGQRTTRERKNLQYNMQLTGFVKSWAATTVISGLCCNLCATSLSSHHKPIRCDHIYIYIQGPFRITPGRDSILALDVLMLKQISLALVVSATLFLQQRQFVGGRQVVFQFYFQ